MSDEVELLPCPFCGGDAVCEIRSDDSVRGKHKHHIFCEACEVVPWVTDHDLTKVIAAWNRRPKFNSGVEINIDHLRRLAAFAYEQGYHEHGYNVLEELLQQLRYSAGRA